MTAPIQQPTVHGLENYVSQMADGLLRKNQTEIYQRTDRLFSFLMIIQWIAGMSAAVWFSPLSRGGAFSETQIHIWLAILLGGLISLFPVYLALARPGSTLTRHVIAVSQMLTAALFIHLTGGRIETHFHVFGSLAFLACYRDWRVLVSATIVVVMDQFVRGVFFPQSVFGVLTASPWRVFEHAAWIVFEDIFLIIAIRQSVLEMKEMARQRAKLAATNEIVEAEVQCRTRDLQTANEIISKTNDQLEHQARGLETQAKELSLAKQKAEELAAFGQILDRSLNEIYIFDAETLRFAHVNYGARDNIGYTMDDLRELTPLDLEPEYTPDSFAELVAPLHEGIQESVEFKTVHRRKDGSRYPVEVHLESSTLCDRHVYVAIILDITERQEFEEQLRLSSENALAANRAKGEFLANMSHEIRTPMTAILGFIDIIVDNVAKPENIDAARTVKANGEYLVNLIDDILDLSKIEAGKLDVEQRDCSPQQVVVDVITLMRVRATAKKLPLRVRFDGPIPETMQTDPTRLRQILINIIGNAIKFTEKGSVQVVTRLLNGAGKDPKLQFDVIDTGIGIPAHKIDKLFLPFTQADSSTTRRFGGTGLGLTICRRLAELLGGEISVSSTVGQGTVFSITVSTGRLDDVRMLQDATELPVARMDTKVADNTTVPLENVQILLAEDGPDNQRLISFLLSKAGAEVVLANNGKIAFDLATAAMTANRPYDAILMDMQMPVMDGYEATRRLRDDGHSLPIIAVTAHAMAGDRQKCLDAGCDDYVTKPIDRKKLIDLLESHVEQTKVEVARS